MSTPTTPPEPPETNPAEPRRLTRSSSDKVLGGVSGGLGRYFDIDPIIFRIGFVVLALAGGAGLLAYAAAWLLVPADLATSEAPTGRNRLLTVLGAGLLAIAALVALGRGLWFAGPPLIGFGLIAVLGVALWRAAENRGGDGGRTLRRAGLGLLLIVVTGVGFVAVTVGAVAGGGAVIAGLVIAIGTALCVSAFVGGARWLVLPALVMAIPLGFVAASGIDVKGGIGDRDYRPTNVAELRDGYKLGAGQLRLDLRSVDLPAGRTPLKLHIGVGSLRVLVPQDVCVASNVRVGAGYARVLDRDNAGVDVDWRNSPIEGAGTKRLVIDGKVGIGELQVAHDVSEFDQHVRRGQFDRNFGDPIDSGDTGQSDDAACQAAA
jgi:phage shock protein PspC (stress-responsive transcriptional regulator)